MLSECLEYAMAAKIFSDAAGRTHGKTIVCL